MYVLPGLAFILPPKCATRSTEAALREIGAKRLGGRHAVKVQAFEGRAVYANIRNPFDVVVSWFLYSNPRNLTFDKWLDLAFQRNCYLRETSLHGAKYATRFFRYEDGIAQQLNAALAEHGYPAVEFPRIGFAPERKPYREYYTPELRAMVADKFAADLELFGYEF